MSSPPFSFGQVVSPYEQCFPSSAVNCVSRLMGVVWLGPIAVPAESWTNSVHHAHLMLAVIGSASSTLYLKVHYDPFKLFTNIS